MTEIRQKLDEFHEWRMNGMGNRASGVATPQAKPETVAKPKQETKAAPATPAKPAAPVAQPKPEFGIKSTEPAPVQATPEPTNGNSTENSQLSISAAEDLIPFLALHPDGLTIEELEQHFKATRSQLSAKLKKLIESGKVRKNDKLYLAI
jgi:DNA-binding transcriptional ArsR family regulator